MNFIYFFQFQPSTLNLLEIEFQNFFFYFFMKLSRSHGPDHEFNRLTQVILSFFYLFFKLIFLFHPSIMS